MIKLFTIFVTKHIKMKPAEILKLYREKIGLTQDNIASFLGIKREMISYFENGTREPSIEHYEKLAQLFGIELADFFEENEDLVKTNVAFAFRATQIQDGDITQIASFRKIISNHIKLQQLKEKSQR